MPGLVGFACHGSDKYSSIKVLQKMRDMMAHHDFYAKDELYCDGFVCSSRTHINVIQKEPQPYQHNGLYIWLDGEIHNQKKMAPEYADMTDPQILLHLYKHEPDFAFLKAVDGIYSAVIYDSKQRKVYLFTDRYGLRPLYLTVYRGQIVWASEAKVFLALPDYSPEISQTAVKEFIEIGYLLEDRTWFKGVELLSSGTVLAWDIKKHSMKRHRYWWWDKIRPSSNKFNENEIIEELGRLFIDSVERRTKEDIGYGLFLSGGLDSRAILAAMPDRSSHIDAFTFGQECSNDIRIAALAAKVKGAVHHIFDINKDNWIKPRLDGVWWTDGQTSLMHMHGIEHLNSMRDLSLMTLNGFAGDLILGGSYLNNKGFIDNLNWSLIAESMSCSPDLIENKDNYMNLTKADYYFLQNRVRKFTYNGIRQTLTSVNCRMPFYDNELIEFIYSFHDSLRYRGSIYKKMLIKWFPDFFKTIPYSKYGTPISRPSFITDAFYFSGKVKRKLLKEIGRFGLRFLSLYFYTDYPNWLRQEPALSLCNSVLTSPSAIYPEYISKQKVLESLERHLNGKNYSEAICRYLTLEIWLQQVFKGKYRPEYN